MQEKTEKIFELGAEGGSLTIYKITEGKNQDWYFHRTIEMAFQEFDLNGIDKSSIFSMSFPEAMFKLLNQYPYCLNLYPLYVNDNYKEVVIEFLKQKVNEIDNIQTWENLLGIEIIVNK